MKFSDIIPLLEEKKDNWLYNWFKNVPENKITKTFFGVEFMPLDTKQMLKGNYNNIKKITYSKNEILDILSKNTQTVQLPEKDFQAFIGGALAAYIKLDSKDTMVVAIKNMEQRLKKYQNDYNALKAKLKAKPPTKMIGKNGKPVEDTDVIYADMNKLLITVVSDKIKVAKFFQQNAGKIILPIGLAKKMDDSGMTSKEATRHETVHYLYDMTQESAKTLIRKICAKSKCDNDYFNDESEIYAYLFTLRSKFKMEPIDVIKNVNLSKGEKNSTISIVYDRGGKEYIIKDTLPTKSATIEAMVCCTGDFGSSLKALHNGLASNAKPDQSNMA
jgi:hypothetical protein